MEKRNVIPLATHFETVARLREQLNSKVRGQEKLVTRLLIALLSDGHLLVEGAPGLAKTRAVKALAQALEGSFHRIQFTPDLLPADLTGTDIYRPETGEFTFQPGPLLHNIVLADEINRAPAKVQSALLEAMAEQQITIGQTTYQLPELFMVMATQNPIEQEGTYPLPEAQLDRFLMYTQIGYPSREAEHEILQLVNQEERAGRTARKANEHMISIKTILAIRNEVLDIHVSHAMREYMVQLVLATRDPKPYGVELDQWVRFGASPRGTLALDRCARAHAWLANRDYVAPEDVHEIAHDVLRHRIILTFEAEAEGISADDFINELLNRVPVP